MISGGSRYGRKGIGLGFDGGEGMMEETELEEGEAYSYDNNNWNVSSIDPDVSLSYLVSFLLYLLFFLFSIIDHCYEFTIEIEAFFCIQLQLVHFCVFWLF